MLFMNLHISTSWRIFTMVHHIKFAHSIFFLNTIVSITIITKHRPCEYYLCLIYAMHVALLLNKLFQTLKFEVINMVNNQQIQNLGLLQFLFHGGVRYISVVIKYTFSIKVWRILLAYNDVDKTKRLILSDADRSMFALWKNACM